ncbi:hypothetical protein CEY16_05425 [Halalkalibacillus sediminis]|uniref:HK97 gp10 family phage protein n=1 Tax=Halalkalibacillus sediminis TaxID=2018042 RepID=A0A2I0QY02_9BACI|nr:HK97-gp10 family putative phage morphogenesis protein [Halalkalibacillus sediminis]PKR79188.1 hypothetical protein CEY16_05425 [Halalkalibacillus sediminis]
MSVKVSGLDRLLNDLENRFGEKEMQRISDRALEEAADVFVHELKQQFQSFRDTGASIREITLSKPYSEQGARTIKVHWKGPDERYRVIHLNEFGTVKNPNPAGKGAIARALRNSEKAYHNTIRRVVERGI